MYLMVETIQREEATDSPEWRTIRETFKSELGQCVFQLESKIIWKIMIYLKIHVECGKLEMWWISL